MNILLILILAILLFGGLGPWHGYSSAWGYGPLGGAGLLIIVLIALVLMGRL